MPAAAPLRVTPPGSAPPMQPSVPSTLYDKRGRPPPGSPRLGDLGDPPRSDAARAGIQAAWPSVHQRPQLLNIAVLTAFGLDIRVGDLVGYLSTFLTDLAGQGPSSRRALGCRPPASHKVGVDKAPACSRTAPFCKGFLSLKTVTRRRSGIPRPAGRPSPQRPMRQQLCVRRRE